MILKKEKEIMQISGRKRIISAFILGSYFSLLCPFTMNAQSTEFKKESPIEKNIKEEKAEALITSKDGGFISLGEASIEIPEGALKEDTVISITKLKEVSDTGESLYNAIPDFGGYRFLPAGTKFEKDVIITLPYNKQLNSKPQVLDELYTYFYDIDKNCWIKLERLEIDKEMCVVHSLSNHFTDMINATLTLPESATPVDVNLNSIKNLEAAKPDNHLIKFNSPQANNMGNASFSFELGIPSGRKGMQPQLSISYNSDFGNSIMGKGFEINYGSCITTDTRLGLPDYDTNDLYLLDGIMLEKVEQNGTTIRYEMQKETSYNRILRYNAGSDGDYWEVTDKNGTKRIYAQNPSSCTGSGRKTFTWNLTEIKDINGNNIFYKYMKIDDYVYPDRIFYTGYGETQGNYEVRFNYGNREDIRVDARSKSIVACKKILTDITTHYNNGEAIRKYNFCYKEGLAKEKMLTGIIVSNNAGENYTYTFDYIEPKIENGHIKYFDSPVEWKNGMALKTGKSDSGGGTFSTSTGVGVGDISGTLDVRLTGGLQGNTESSESESESVLTDINGDGRVDAVRFQNGKISYRLNTGTGFSDNEEYIYIENFKLDSERSSTNSFGWNIYGGAGVNAQFSAGLGVTYSQVTQETTSCIANSIMDVDADGKTDILLTGRNYYLKNTSQNGSVNFEKYYFDTVNSSIVSNNYRTLDDNDIKKYNDAYRIHTPFRQWISKYEGIVEISENLKAAPSFNDASELKAFVYKNGSENEEDTLSLSLSKNKKTDSKKQK